MIQTQPPPIVPFLFEKKKIGANVLDAILIWIAPLSAGIQVNMLICIMALLAERYTFRSDNGVYEKGSYGWEFHS
jgi:hypothetical protein